MKTCVNWKVVGALALVGIAVLALAPGRVGGALPLLVLAACPLSMFVMMRMSGTRHSPPEPAPAPAEPGPGRAGEGADPARLQNEIRGPGPRPSAG